MKKLLLASFFACVSSTALSGGYGAAGCGLGSIVFGSKPGVFQILAGTTNVTFGSQTFGITTGTSNCGKGLISVSNKEFVTNNIAQLKMDAARGQGEVLQAFSNIYGCGFEDLNTFGKAVQAEYQNVFSSDDAEAVLEKAATVVSTGGICLS